MFILPYRRESFFIKTSLSVTFALEQVMGIAARIQMDSEYIPELMIIIRYEIIDSRNRSHPFS